MKNKIKLLPLLLFLLGGVTDIFSQEEKTKGSIVLGSDTQKADSIGTNYILSIGINSYKNWTRLDNAVNDAIQIQELFTSRLGFKALRSPIIDKEATKDKILKVIENDLPEKLKENDNLIVFFSGHGETYERKIGSSRRTIGYVIPQDAKNASSKEFDSYIKADELMNKINELPAKHILLILDACKSGIAVNVAKNKSSKTYAEDLRKKMSRNVITSAQGNQPAADGGPILGHSLFAGTLIEGLKNGTIDRNDRNGLVTSTEIGLFLQQEVSQNSKAKIKQTPNFGAFGYDEGGELVIDLHDDSYYSLKTQLDKEFQKGNFDGSWKLAEELAQKYPKSLDIYYYNFRKAMFQRDTKTALENLSTLDSTLIDYEQDFYLTHAQVRKMLLQLRYWEEALKVNTEISDLEIEIRNYNNGETLTECGLLYLAGVQLKDIKNKQEYRLKLKDAYQFNFKNKSASPFFVYAFLTYANGTFEVVRLFKDFDVLDHGIQPNTEEISMVTGQNGKPGVEKFTFIFSRERLRRLETPVTFSSNTILSPWFFNKEKNTLNKKDFYLIFGD